MSDATNGNPSELPPPWIYRWAGGRKGFNGILFAFLFTVAFYWLDTKDVAALKVYGVLLALDLFSTSTLHVVEDILRVWLGRPAPAAEEATK